MKLFFIFILFLSNSCQSMDVDSAPIESLKKEFRETISYEFLKYPEAQKFSEKEKITPIRLSNFIKILSEDRAYFEGDVWYLKHKDNYEGASYFWYTKLLEDGGFTFYNLQEFYWCLVSSNKYSNVVGFSKKILQKFEEIQ